MREFRSAGPMARAEFGELAERLLGALPKPVLGTGSGNGKKGGK